MQIKYRLKICFCSTNDTSRSMTMNVQQSAFIVESSNIKRKIQIVILPQTSSKHIYFGGSASGVYIPQNSVAKKLID